VRFGLLGLITSIGSTKAEDAAQGWLRLGSRILVWLKTFQYDQHPAQLIIT